MEPSTEAISPFATPRLAATAAEAKVMSSPQLASPDLALSPRQTAGHGSDARRPRFRQPSEGNAYTPSTPLVRSSDAGTLSKNIILTEAGKAAWYDESGQVVDAYIIGIAGGSASGKTSVARSIIKELPAVSRLAIISQDSFYKPLSPAESKLAFASQYDFDHPKAFDHDLLSQCIKDLKKGRAVEIPNYSFVHHQRMKEKTYLYGPNVVLLEGLFVLQDPAIRELLDLKIFVQADSDLMLARRILRDVKERGRDVEGILKQYLTFVKPSMDNFISPTMRFADIIVPVSAFLARFT